LLNINRVNIKVKANDNLFMEVNRKKGSFSVFLHTRIDKVGLLICNNEEHLQVTTTAKQENS